ncbi:MAG: hypothetical protein HOP08_14890 [Cyclobacteriaceae bacterium]|nr:hypothetical protein [Cyclobacteriaceae bacterium]
MRTSLNDIQEIEKFQREELSPGDSILFQVRMILDPVLKLNVTFQNIILQVVQLYHRKKLKVEVKQIHHDLFSSPSSLEFQQTVKQIFKS